MMAVIAHHKTDFLNRYLDSSRRQKDSGDTNAVQCWTTMAITFNDPNFIAGLHEDEDGRDLGMSAEPTGHQTDSGEFEKYVFFIYFRSYSCLAHKSIFFILFQAF
jgi:hypothetical protein